MPIPLPVSTDIRLRGVPHIHSGKVREVFDLGDRILFVASDRVSAFDCVLPTGILLKGCVLNQLSAWWFDRLASTCRHHMVTADASAFPDILQPHADLLRGRAMMVEKAEMVPVECVARGYLMGSGWQEYSESGAVCGIPLRKGYRMSDRLDEPIFTPTTKAETGHDLAMTFDDVTGMIGPVQACALRDLTLQIYAEAAAYARTRGIIIADTKFEFGIVNGDLVLADEALTPDSSRFWPAESYVPGESPPSYDKQFIRDHLQTLDWDRTPPAPELPEEIVDKSSRKYLEAFRVLTDSELVV